ncbi:MAG: DNA-binding protein, partial [Proteobacteria bacterium]|nr:DNA-binding protein [Pseudomonadota bacterium]
MTGYYLNSGLPQPAATSDGLDAPYWQGLRDELLLLQRCQSCEKWQWGPEWICHRCHAST